MSCSDCALKVRLALVISITVLGAPACIGQAPGAPDEGIVTGEAEQASGSIQQCLTYQRGVNGVTADATLWESAPTYNDGASTTLHTGTSSAGFKQALVYFDISDVPAGAHIDSASISLYMSWKPEGSTVDIHEILAPWSEGSVTWDSFDASFDPTAWTSAWAWGGGGSLQIHVDSLVQAWVDGTADNNGILLQELGTERTSFHSSEHGTVSSRPKLKLCYTPAS